METLRFWPLESKVDAATFWSALGERKLHTLKLQEGPVPLRAAWGPSSHSSQPGLLTVSVESLPQAEHGASRAGGAGPAVPLPPPEGGGGSCGFEVLGDLFVLNTAERILKIDRKVAVQQACDRVWAAICSGEAERDPRLLQTAVLLTYCDLKHYKYRYWFAFPALQPPQPFVLFSPPASLAAALGGEAAAAAVAAACDAHVAATGLPACLVCVPSGSTTPDSSTGRSSQGPATAPLTDWEGLQHRQQQQQQQQQQQRSAAAGSGEGGLQLFLAVADSSNLPEHPGWPLRNLLLMAAARWRCRRLRVLCLRQRRGRFDSGASVALDVALPELPPGFQPAPLGGWEPNERGKLGLRIADLAPAMDPRHLAEAAVELNLRLMRWRAAPTLDVGGIAAARCLLLGAGTLGCSVARTLLGWGVRHITFVDNSRVAYSNPVRQSLFNFEDCLAGGKPKAEAAAEAISRIFPGVCARGVPLSVPMPGHPIGEAEVPQVLRDIAELEALVDAHHVVFLLMDTRESRWLPTLLCASRGRLAINAALGFGGFMVMRHGAPLPAEEEEAPAEDREEAHQQQRQQGEEEGEEAEGGAAAGGHSNVEDGGCGEGVPAGEGDRLKAAADQQDASQQQQQQQQQPSEPPSEQQERQGAAAEVAAAVNHRGAPSAAAAAAAAPPRPRLGCYFCNDVVAPLNSTGDRSLDQQCTVARPGLSSIAGSLAVELMAAVLAHPLGAAAPAPGWQPPGGGGTAGGPAGTTAGASRAAGDEEEVLPLGEAPHMIRGQLGGFSQMCLAGQAFAQCTACSPAVVREYRRRGVDFVLEGLLEPKRLEDLTGLTELHQASEAALEAWDSSSSDDEGEEGGVGGGAAGHAAQRKAAGEEEDWEEL